VTLNLAETSVAKNRPSVPHRANLCYFRFSFWLRFWTLCTDQDRLELFMFSNTIQPCLCQTFCCLISVCNPVICQVDVYFYVNSSVRVDLIKWVSNVRPSVRPSTKSFFDSNEIWYVGRGRRMTVCSMTRSKVKVTSPWKSEVRSFWKVISSPFIMGAGKWPRFLKLGALPKAYRGQIFDFCPSFFLGHVTLKFAVSRSWPPVPYGTNLFSDVKS